MRARVDEDLPLIVDDDREVRTEPFRDHRDGVDSIDAARRHPTTGHAGENAPRDPPLAPVGQLQRLLLQVIVWLLVLVAEPALPAVSVTV